MFLKKKRIKFNWIDHHNVIIKSNQIIIIILITITMRFSILYCQFNLFDCVLWIILQLILRITLITIDSMNYITIDSMNYIPIDSMNHKNNLWWGILNILVYLIFLMESNWFSTSRCLDVKITVIFDSLTC